MGDFSEDLDKLLKELGVPFGAAFKSSAVLKDLPVKCCATCMSQYPEVGGSFYKQDILRCSLTGNRVAPNYICREYIDVYSASDIEGTRGPEDGGIVPSAVKAVRKPVSDNKSGNAREVQLSGEERVGADIQRRLLELIGGGGKTSR